MAVDPFRSAGDLSGVRDRSRLGGPPCGRQLSAGARRADRGGRFAPERRGGGRQERVRLGGGGRRGGGRRPRSPRRLGGRLVAGSRRRCRCGPSRRRGDRAGLPGRHCVRRRGRRGWLGRGHVAGVRARRSHRRSGDRTSRARDHAGSRPPGPSRRRARPGRCGFAAAATRSVDAGGARTRSTPDRSRPRRRPTWRISCRRCSVRTARGPICS